MSLTDYDLDLAIEELIVYGMPSVSRDWLGAAIERELTRLLTQQGIPAGLRVPGEIAYQAGGTFTQPPGTDADSLAIQIAQSIYRSIEASSNPTTPSPRSPDSEVQKG